jgi:hypothetical protein
MPKKIPRPLLPFAEYQHLAAVDLQTAADIIGCSKVTLWHWGRSGRIEIKHLSPRIVRVPVSEIRRMLEASK